MILEPDAAQPASELDLETSGVTSEENPAQGVFAGVVKLAVRYRFVNRTKSASYELPAVVSLELSGHWAAVPEGGPSLGPGASNLALFTGISGGAVGGLSRLRDLGGHALPGLFHPGSGRHTGAERGSLIPFD